MSKNGGKIDFSGFSEKRVPDPDFFGPKPPRDQDGANKKVQPNRPSRSGVIKGHTDRQTDRQTKILITLQY